MSLFSPLFRSKTSKSKQPTQRKESKCDTTKKKMMMIKVPLMGFAIWLLFLIFALSHSLSHALQDDATQLLPAGAKFSESSLDEETLVKFDAIGLRKMGNGRKRVAVKRMRKETDANDEREEDQESSRISGLKKKSSNKFLQTSQVNHQETINAKRSRNSRHLRTKLTNSKRSSIRDEETQRFLKAAKEIANLMHKDYKDWAHRKPPINNQEPLH